jgi:hypothetical protein
MGLALGVALGFFVRHRMMQPLGLFAAHRIMRAPDPQYRRAMWEAALAEMERQSPPPQPPRLRLVGQSRVGMQNPRADYHRAWLERIDFRRADLREANFSDSWIRGCDFRGANLAHADFTAAIYDEATRWPEGFDPVEHGARLVGGL